jgi:DMSO/TMAO reductase YedYZ molybdopterin-dependent catalytic subunit
VAPGSLPGVTIRRRGDEHLEITGLAGDPVRLSPADLGSRPGVEEDRFPWPALPAAVLLDGLAPRPGADHVLVESGDGHYRASIPLAELRRGGWLLVGVPAGRGGPVRLVVEDGPTLCWNVKHVASLRFTEGPVPDSVPENPPH